MSFIEKPLDEIEEKTYGPKGLYDVVVSKADDKMDGEFRKGMLLIIDITKAPAGTNVEELNNILHNLSLPLPTDEESKAQNKLRFFKRFCYAFGVDTKGKKSSDFKPTDFIGKKAKGIQVDTKVYEGKTSNVLILPEVPKGK